MSHSSRMLFDNLTQINYYDRVNHHDSEYAFPNNTPSPNTRSANGSVQVWVSTPTHPTLSGLGTPSETAQAGEAVRPAPSTPIPTASGSVWTERVKGAVYSDHMQGARLVSEQVTTHVRWHKCLCSRKCVQRASCHHVLYTHTVLGSDRPLKITSPKLVT